MLMTETEQLEARTHLLYVLNELDEQSQDANVHPAYRAAKDFLERHPAPYSEKEEAGVIKLIDDICADIWMCGECGGVNETITENKIYMAARKFCTGRRQHIACGECNSVFRGTDAEDMYHAHHAMTGH